MHPTSGATAIAIIGGTTAVAYQRPRYAPLAPDTYPRPAAADADDGIVPILAAAAIEARRDWRRRPVTGPVAATLIVDTIPHRDGMSGAIDAARSAGWKATDAALTHRSPWTTFTRGDNLTIHAMLGQGSPYVAPDMGCTLAPRGTSSLGVARLLDDFAYHFGAVYRTRPGITAHALLRTMAATPRRGAQRPPEPRWHAPLPDITTTSAPASALTWSLPADRVKRLPDNVAIVHYDVRAQFLAAMAAARIPWGPIVQHGPTGAIEPTVSGYWRLKIHQTPERRFPIIPRGRITRGIATLTTPMALAAEAAGYGFEIIDSARAEKGTRFLRTYAESIRDALIEAAHSSREPVVRTIKASYAECVGMFASPGGSIERTDWRDTIVDTATAEMIRKTDLIPDGFGTIVEIFHDSVWIAMEDTSPENVEKITGKKIGNFKHVGTEPKDEYLAGRKRRGAS